MEKHQLLHCTLTDLFRKPAPIHGHKARNVYVEFVEAFNTRHGSSQSRRDVLAAAQGKWRALKDGNRSGNVESATRAFIDEVKDWEVEQRKNIGTPNGWFVPRKDIGDSKASLSNKASYSTNANGGINSTTSSLSDV